MGDIRIVDQTTLGERGLRLEQLLELNEQLVIDQLRSRGRSTRPELAAELDLSAATVSRIIRRLLDRGLVREEPGLSTGGRPRTSLVINPTSGVVMGIDLGGTRCHGILADLAGATLSQDERAIADAGSPFETLLACIEQLSASPDRGGAPLAGLAVGVPAVIDRVTGRATASGNAQWQGFPLVSELQRHVAVPFVVENDINLGALGHAWKGDARGRRDFVVLGLGTGIGAGVVIDGRLVKGHANAAGAVGRMVLERSALLAAGADERGSLDAAASGEGIGRSARRMLDDGSWRPAWYTAGARVTSREVIDAAAEGDAFAASIVAEVTDHVAMAVIGIASVVDPELVILDGAVGRALGGMVPRIRSLVARHLLVAPEIVVSSLGREGTVMGAIAAALQLSRSGPQRP